MSPMESVRWAISAVLAAAIARAGPTYTISALEVPSGVDETTAVAMSGNGVVAGSLYTRFESQRGAVWIDGGATQIPLPAGALGLYAFDANNASHAVGYYGTLEGERPYLWNGTSVQELGIVPGALNSRAEGINNSGVVVGTDFTQAGERPWIWDGGVRGLPIPAGAIAAGAVDINEAGQVAGTTNLNGYLYATLWTGEQPQLLESRANAHAIASGVNDAGQVAGTIQRFEPDRSAAATWLGGVLTELDALPGDYGSYSSALNAHGDVVGGSIRDDLQRAVLWRGGDAIDLDAAVNDPEWQLFSAVGIDDAGRIAGNGFYQGELRGFVLTPVPEPATATSCLALSMLLVRRRAEIHVRGA